MLRETSFKQQFIQKLRRRLSKAMPYPITQVQIPLPCNEITVPSLIDWLAKQNEPVKFYWRDREGNMELASLGSALNFQSVSVSQDQQTIYRKIAGCLSSTPQPIRFYGRISFPRYINGKCSTAQIFVLPRFELQRTYAGELLFSCNLIRKHDDHAMNSIINGLNRLHFSPESSSIVAAKPRIMQRRDIPNYLEWCQLFNKAMGFLTDSTLEKIVLSKRSDFIIDQELDPFSLLKRMTANNSNSFHYYSQSSHSEPTFFGGSPELLYQRQNQELYTEAIAGTRIRSIFRFDDQQFSQNLLQSNKDRCEHQYVLKSLCDGLQTLAKKIYIEKQPHILKLEHLQHLRQSIRASLFASSTDADIWAKLHPSAAVGGLPKLPALQRIQELEPHPRQWYSGMIGWLCKDSAQFAVAIRSASCVANTLTVFAGVGIVKDSEADAEWQELEQKIQSFLKLTKLDQ